MPFMSGMFTPGEGLAFVESLQGPLRDIARAEYHYFRGNAEATILLVEPLLDSKNHSIRLSALLLFLFANLSVGHLNKARYGFARIQAETDAPPHALVTLLILRNQPKYSLPSWQRHSCIYRLTACRF